MRKLKRVKRGCLELAPAEGAQGQMGVGEFAVIR